ncbi:MAG: hypothetical protein ACUVV1_08130 [Fimbriimonadales bacterium]
MSSFSTADSPLDDMRVGFYRGDLVGQSSASGAMTPAPIMDAFGDIVSGVHET